MTDVLDELRGFCHGKTETVYTRAVAEIERLREATRWRSVAEEMPEHDVRVIACWTRHGSFWPFGAHYNREANKGNRNRSKVAERWESTDLGSTDRPTHWIPIEPPK